MIPVILVLALTFIESFILFLPITLFYLIILSIHAGSYQKNAYALPLAFLGGLSIDILQVHTLGTTAVVFLVIVLSISLYKRKLESSAIFTSLAVFLSVSIYSYFTGQMPMIALFQGMFLTFFVFVALFLVRPVFVKK